MKKLFLSLSFLPALAFAQAVLPTSWSFINPSPTGASANSPTGPATTYPTKTGWSTKLDVTVTGATPFSYATGADGNAAGRLDAQDEYIMIAFAEKPGSLTYQIRGTAISAPYFSGSFKVQESVDGTAWVDAKEYTSMSNTFASESVSLSASSRFVRFYYTTKVSGSNVALDNITLNAPPAPAFGIAVKKGTTALANGANVVIGNTTTTAFTLQNIGTLQSLIIDSIIVSGTHAGDYSFGTNMDTVLAGSSKNIDLTFTPSANGSRFATLSIYSNDVDRTPFTIDLYGIGGTFATEPSAVTSLALQNVKTYAMDVKYSKSATAEGYLILRKTGSSLTEVPMDGVTYKRGDTIGGAQVAYIGADTLTVKPTYILANTSYSFAAFAYSGPAGFENYNTTAAPSASATTPNGAPGNYYATIDANNPAFITALNTRIKNPQDTVFYGNYAATLINNFLTRDTLGGKRVVNCVYSGDAYIYDEPFLWWGNTGNGTLTREHTFAQSWMPSNTGGSWPEVGGKEVLEYNDQHHLFPTHQLNANQKRSNKTFGMVVNATYTSPTGFGKLGTDINGLEVYEPKDDQKGDLARALFYMLVRYNGDRGNTWRMPTSQNIATLLLWHQQDPPSALEIARHEYIYSIQKNRNPFIDHPEWVNRINFSNLTYVPDPSNKTITLTAPNGGEEWWAGTTKNITWTSLNVDSVIIQFRHEPADFWTPISTPVAASNGSFSWVVPIMTTNTGSIKISAKDDILLADSSDSFFSISDHNPLLTLNTPIMGGDLLHAGSVFPILWFSQQLDTVTFLYRVNPGAPWIKIADNIVPSEVTGVDTFLWTVPDVSTTTAQLMVYSNTDPTLFDESYPFIISGTSPIQFIKIFSPTWNTDWRSMDNIPDTIRWESRLVDSLKIDLMVWDSLLDKNLGVASAAAGYFLVTDDMIKGKGGNVFRVRLTDTKSPFLSQKSMSFMITSSSGINNLSDEATLSVYPNPSKGEVIIDINETGLSGGHLSIMDITGRILMNKDISRHESVQLGPAGIYFLKLQTENGSVVKKIIVE